MRAPQETRSLSSSEVDDLLLVLELPALPDHERLKKHFSHLLKRYHPDRNRDRTEWAHEKTRAIIAANHRLRKYLDARPAPRPTPAPVRFTGSINVSAAAKPTHDATARPFAPNPIVEGAGFPVQLVRSSIGNFALPVNGIERIRSFDPDQVTSLVPGEFVFIHNSEVYRLYDLNGDPPRDFGRDAYLVLFRGSRGRFGLLADSETEFAGIEECSRADLRRSFMEGAGDLQLFISSERFIFPARLRRLL